MRAAHGGRNAAHGDRSAAGGDQRAAHGGRNAARSDQRAAHGASIGVDFDGTIISLAVSRAASDRWFSYISDLLDDPSVAPEDAWLDATYRLMGRLKGKAATTAKEKARYLSKAREHYRTLYLEIVANDAERVLHHDVVRRLRSLRDSGHRLILLSTTPQPIVAEALLLLGIRDLFDGLFCSPQEELLLKQELLARFVAAHGAGALARYIGDEDGDEAACLSLGIPFVRCRPGATPPFTW